MFFGSGLILHLSTNLVTNIKTKTVFGYFPCQSSGVFLSKWAMVTRLFAAGRTTVNELRSTIQTMEKNHTFSSQRSSDVIFQCVRLCVIESNS